jgi:hypothetical protein
MSDVRFPPRCLDNEYRRKMACADIMGAPDGYWCKIVQPNRTLDQNSAQWPYLEGFSKQKQWPVNGVMCWLTEDEWKDVLTAAFEKEVNPRLAAGFDGGVVMLGRRTSQFGKKKFSEWYEFLMAAAALSGVTPVYKNEQEE